MSRIGRNRTHYEPQKLRQIIGHLRNLGEGDEQSILRLIMSVGCSMAADVRKKLKEKYHVEISLESVRRVF